MERRAIMAAACLLAACAEPGHGDWRLDEQRKLLWLDEPSAAGPAGGENALGQRLGVSVPIGVARHHLVLSAADTLSLGEAASVVEANGDGPSTIAGLGGVELGNDAQLGSVYHVAATALRFGARSASRGFVKARGAIQLAEGSTVAVGALAHVRIGAEAYEWSVELPAGTGTALEALPGGLVSLERDVHYTAVRVPANARVALSSGHHYVDELVLAEQARLEIEPSAGPVYLWVQRRLEWRGTLAPDVAASRLLVGYGGDETPVLGAGARGTFVCPHADIVLNDTAGSYVGAFFARHIRVGARVNIRHSAFDAE
jgi:hypothetical protein